MSREVLDLFSGIGGFSLGLERTGGFQTVAFCEVNEFCSKILKKHWPKVQNLGDITRNGIEPMLSLEGSRVRIFLSQDQAPDLPAPVRGYGDTWQVPFAWYDRATQSWRTWQRCLEGGWAEYAETWPRAGMTRNGIAYQRQPLVQNIYEIESGLLPTPCARDYRGAATVERTERMRETSSRGLDLPSELRYRGWAKKASVAGVETMMGYPIGYTELPHSETQSSRKSRSLSGEQSLKQRD